MLAKMFALQVCSTKFPYQFLLSLGSAPATAPREWSRGTGATMGPTPKVKFFPYPASLPILPALQPARCEWAAGPKESQFFTSLPRIRGQNPNPSRKVLQGEGWNA